MLKEIGIWAPKGMRPVLIQIFIPKLSHLVTGMLWFPE